MKSYQADFIHPAVLNNERISSWFTMKGESIQDNYKIEGLNLGFNTDEHTDIIQANRDYLAESISTPIAKIAFANQIHETDIAEVTKGGIYSNIDGFITQKTGIALAIQVADCGAILLGDTENGIIAAVHAGWRGAVGGIVSKALTKMMAMGSHPENIEAFVSPCISIENFEVGDEVAAQFPEPFVDRNSYEKPHIDLKNFIRNEMLESGLKSENIEINKSCTVSDKNLYSYRRNGTQAGRMMGVIKLNDTI